MGCGKSEGKCTCTKPRPPMDVDADSKISVSGGSGSGKTHWTVEHLLLHEDSPWKGGEVFVLAHDISRDQPAFKKLPDKFDGKVTFVNGLPEDDEAEQQLMDAFKKNHADGVKQVVVFDDLMLDTKASRGLKLIQRLHIAGRHLGLGVVNIAQSPMTDRLCRMQTQMFVLFDTSLADAIAALARQVHPESKGSRVMKAFRQSTARKHGFLVVDTRSGAGVRALRDSSWERCYDFSVL